MQRVVELHTPHTLKTDGDDVTAHSAMIVNTAGGMPRKVHRLPETERAVLEDYRGITRMHCRGKVEDAGATITATYYRQSRKRGLSKNNAPSTADG